MDGGMWSVKSGFLVGKSYADGIKWNHLAILAFLSMMIGASEPVATEHDRPSAHLFRGGDLKHV